MGTNALFEAGGSRGDLASSAHSANFGNIQWTQPEAICKFGVNKFGVRVKIQAVFLL